MTVASLPFWIVLSGVGLARTGAPHGDQLAQCAIVAVVGGLLATTLFFAATARVRHHPARLAAVEATQSGEVVFAAGLEVAILHIALPSLMAWGGILLIVGRDRLGVAGRGGQGRQHAPGLSAPGARHLTARRGRRLRAVV